MQNFLLAFYVLFFATGFMGGSALFVMGLRVRSRLIRPLLVFQVLFLLGLGLVVVFFYLQGFPEGIAPSTSLILMLIITSINAAVYAVVIVLIRRISPPASRRKGFPAAAEILAGLVIVKTLANMALMAALTAGRGGFLSPGGMEAWSLGGYILSGLAMASFGIVARGPVSPDEPPVIRSLLKAYGLCALIFAPMGLLEYAAQTAGIPALANLSLDHFFYLAWNIVSMTAVVRLFKPGETGTPLLDKVPEERIRTLGLSNREAEMAVFIARGLANKEIASELNISPATVRTHIYNLYQKAGARSRVELLNKLRS